MKKIVLLPLLLALSSCAAHQAEQKVNEDLKREPGVFSHQEIGERAHEVILNSPTLTDKQRNEMKALFAEVMRKNVVIRSDIGKLKGVLFKTLFSREEKGAELKVIKKKLLALNQSKMDLMLDALDKAVVILGKNGEPQQFERLFLELDKVHASDR